jgi:hypothetical protein
MTLNSRQRRILRRRSPPRIVTIDGGSGVESPHHKIQPIETKPIRDPYKMDENSLNPVLLEIVSTGKNFTIPESETERTTVTEQKYQETSPRIPVSRIDSIHLRKQKLAKDQEKQEEREKPERIPLLGSDYTNRKVRRKRTAAILADGALLEPGTRQVWKLPETYDKRFKDSSPELVLNGEQGIRVTFHRDAGGIIQALELPPSENPMTVSVPRSTRFFTLEGLGGKGYIKSDQKVRNESLTIKYPSAEFSAIGFQRTSKIHQIGMFRYLARGCYIQARESIASETMENRTVFYAGEVLSKIDDIRFYCTGHIRTFVVVIKTRDGAQPSLQIAMDGIQAQRRPTLIKRDDGIAYVWSVKGPEGFMGPAILDIRTDETTDVHSVISYQADAELVVEYLSESRWTELVGDGPISANGKSMIRWKLGIPPVKPEMAKPAEKKRQVEEKRVVEKTKPDKKLTPVSKEDASLPRIELPDATVGDEYSFDVSVFAQDDDEGDQIQFKKISGPAWFKLTNRGELLGIPTSDDVGTNECKVRVVDNQGLSSDAILVVVVNEKILNRAPYWNPNVKVSTEVDTTKNQPIEKGLKAKETAEKKESSPKSSSRRRRR